MPARSSLRALLGFVAVRQERRLGVDAGPHAKAIDKDIHQPHDAFLPAGLVVHVAHSDEGAQKVLGTDVGAYLAGGDGADRGSRDACSSRISRGRYTQPMRHPARRPGEVTSKKNAAKSST